MGEVCPLSAAETGNISRQGRHRPWKPTTLNAALAGLNRPLTATAYCGSVSNEVAGKMTTNVLERTINLAGCGNFRDLGGYQAQDGRTVRWRIKVGISGIQTFDVPPSP